jgi:hypothetical protein
MHLQTTAPIPVVKFVPQTSLAAVHLIVNMDVNTITVAVDVPGVALPLLNTAPIPAQILTALQQYAQSVGEALLGVPPGSTTVVAA